MQVNVDLPRWAIEEGTFHGGDFLPTTSDKIPKDDKKEVQYQSTVYKTRKSAMESAVLRLSAIRERNIESAPRL